MGDIWWDWSPPTIKEDLDEWKRLAATCVDMWQQGQFPTLSAAVSDSLEDQDVFDWVLCLRTNVLPVEAAISRAQGYYERDFGEWSEDEVWQEGWYKAVKEAMETWLYNDAYHMAEARGLNVSDQTL